MEQRRQTKIPFVILMILSAITLGAATKGYGTTFLLTDDFETVSLDTKKWVLNNYGPPSDTSLARIEDGAFVISSGAPSPGVHLDIASKHIFSGDIEATVDYSFTHISGTGYAALGLLIQTDGANNVFINRAINTLCGAGCDKYFITTSSTSEGPKTQKVIDPISNTGRMRIVRTGSTWDFYLDQGSGFMHEFSWTTGFTDDARILLVSNSSHLGTGAAPEFISLFDNFEAWECDPIIEATMELIDKVVDMNLHLGISNNLDGKLDTALNALDDVNVNNDLAALNSLEAFINAVQAQRGNMIAEAQADELIADAQAIIDVLGGL